MRVPFLDWEDPLEEGMATHSSILAWGIPGTGEPGRPWSTVSKELGTTEYTCMYLEDLHARDNLLSFYTYLNTPKTIR